MSVPAQRLEATAALISRWPAVTHNYERAPLRGACPFNLWFTLTARSQEELGAAIDQLAEATGLLSGILDGAKTVAQKSVEVAEAVKPLAEKLEPLVEKVGVAALWVAKLWLMG